MGRSKLCENKESKRYDHVAGMLTGGIRKQRLTTKMVSEKTGIPERTINDRIQNPEKTRLKDLYRLCDATGVQITFKFKEEPE